ncbi:MAG TPA: HAD family phosphatase, partial [Erysipelotrichaceae bacterium]|nr:HAD family phosphatase [Erysipelotrichaceae bacterium]
MDGVLIDSEPIYMHHVLEFYRRFDIHVPYKEVVKLAGSSHEAGLEMMSAWWKEDITPSEFEKFYEANSDEEIVYSEILNPYVLYVLKRLKARGMKLAIASSSPKQAIVTMVNE